MWHLQRETDRDFYKNGPFRIIICLLNDDKIVK